MPLKTLFGEAGLNITMAANLLGFLLLFSQTPRRRKYTGAVLVSAIAFLCAFVLRYYEYRLLSMLLFSFVTLCSCYDVGGLNNAIYLSVIFGVLESINRILPFNILSLIMEQDTMRILFSFPIRLLVFFFFRRYIKDLIQTPKGLPDYVLLFICLAQVLFVSYIRIGISEKGGIFAYVVMAVCLGTLGTLYSVFWHMGITRKELEIREIEANMKKRAALFEYKAEVDGRVARLYHDMRFHLRNLESLAGDGELKKAIGEFRGELSGYEQIYHTGNHVVDVLLNEAAAQAKEKVITLEAYVDFSAGDFLRSIDICSMVGNALSNAMEAAEGVEDPYKRTVIIKATALNRYLTVKVQNYFCGQLRRDGDRFLSIKEDAQEHGKGLASIEYSAKRYGGKCAAHIDRDLFTLEIFLPLP